jgi:hypothetical protein
MRKVMTKEEIIKTLEALDADVTYVDYRGTLHVCLEDWGCEGDRDYDDPEAVNDFLLMLDRTSLSYDNEGYYEIYGYDGFRVKLGCASFDI